MDGSTRPKPKRAYRKPWGEGGESVVLPVNSGPRQSCSANRVYINDVLVAGIRYQIGDTYHRFFKSQMPLKKTCQVPRILGLKHVPIRPLRVNDRPTMIQSTPCGCMPLECHRLAPRCLGWSGVDRWPAGPVLRNVRPETRRRVDAVVAPELKKCN